MNRTPYSELPNPALLKDAGLSQSFINLNCDNYHDACDYVWRLPYGRTSDSGDWKLVLSEGKGTCGTKHALLKVLADELRIDVALTLGIFHMNGANTPGIESILKTSNIDYIPEAHCYLLYKGNRIDLTKFNERSHGPISKYYLEQEIEPDDIGEAKKLFHKKYFLNEYGESQVDKYWAVREECIHAIST